MPKGGEEGGGGRGRGPWEGRRRLCKDNTAHRPVPAWDTATRKAQIRVSWGPPAAAQFQLCSAELTRLRKPLLQTPSLLDQGTKRGENSPGLLEPQTHLLPYSVFPGKEHSREETQAGPSRCSPCTPRTIFSSVFSPLDPELLAASSQRPEKLVQFSLKGSLFRNICISKEARRERTMLIRTGCVQISDSRGTPMFQ